MIRVEPATLAALEALVEGDDVFARRFGVRVEPGWAVFPEAVPRALDAVRAGAAVEWGTHLLFDDQGVVVGIGGWKGEPVDGMAELGYAVAPRRQGQGIATAAVRVLVDRGRAAGLQRVLAHTLAEESASTSVLRRCGFVCVGEVGEVGEVDEVDEPNGAVWRWELPLTPAGSG